MADKEQSLWYNPGPPVLQPLDRKNVKYPFVTVNDIDSFLFLFCDNMSSLLGIFYALLSVGSIVTYCSAGDACDGPGTHLRAWSDMVSFKFLPGLGIAIAFGNYWYAWMAFKLASYEKRTDVTALPYGVNTPAGFLTAFSIMLPVGFKYKYGFPEVWADPDLWATKCWNAGCSACVVCGIVEMSGCLIGPVIVRVFSRSALFCPLAGVGFVWLGMVPFISCMSEPIKAAMPLAIGFAGFYGNGGNGLTAMIGHPKLKWANFAWILFFGTLFKWCGLGKYDPTVEAMAAEVARCWETYAGKNKMGAFTVLEGLPEIASSFTVVLPISLISFIETMENVELAAQKGDQYNMRETMIADGLGSLVGGLFGSICPTTSYIGHSRHKAVNATSGYSILNGTTYFVLCMSGLLPFVAAVLDEIAVAVSLVIVGLMILQDAVELCHPRHIPAFFLGLSFMVADPWHFDLKGYDTNYCSWSTRGRGRGLRNMYPGGGVMCALITTQVLCDLSDAKFAKCAIFCIISTFLSLFGLMHGNNIVNTDGDFMNEVLAYTADGPKVTAGMGELTIAWADPAQEPFEAHTGGKGGYNEGWRFCVMYMMIALYCVIHGGIQKVKPEWLPKTEGLGYCPSVDDPDGLVKKAPPWKQEGGKQSSTA